MAIDTKFPAGTSGDADPEDRLGLDAAASADAPRLVQRSSFEGRMPSLGGATGWLNSPPLTPAILRGKVVAVQFWTYTCINWLRTLAAVRAWERVYRDSGLVVIGVHSPEFSFERDVANVRQALDQRRMTYPIAVDSDFEVWDAFANHYWPSLFLVDREGRIRLRHIGESDYGAAEEVLRELLRDGGPPSLPRRLSSVVGTGIEAAADWESLRSPETYLGYARGSGLASPGGARRDVPSRYRPPHRMRLGQWALAGEWALRAESADGTAGGGRIECVVHARDVHVVMGPAPGAGPVRFRVLLDGAAPDWNRGEDVDDAGNGTVTDQRLYNLIRRRGGFGESTIEVEFTDPGIQLFVLTFG